MSLLNKPHFVIATFAVLALTACGGGGGGSGGGSNNGGAPGVATYTGKYIDAPTKGLFYRASPSGLNGLTDDNGSFSFQANDTITFQIQSPTGGNINAGSITPATPPNTSTPVIASVLDMSNGVAIAQILQSLGGTGAVIDVGYTTPSVSVLNTSTVTALNNFVGSGGTTTKPPEITIDATTASSNATKALASVAPVTSSITTVSGLTAFNTYFGGLNANSLGLNAKGLGAGFGYFEASGKLFNICSYQPPTLLSAGLSWESCDASVPVGGQLSNWTVSTLSGGNLQIVETISAGSQVGSVNTVTSAYNTSANGAFTNNITNIPNLPAGLTQSGSGMYSVMQSNFSVSSLAGKTIIVNGDSNCSNGKMKYVMNSTGTGYVKSCYTSTVAGSSFTSLSGVTANQANLPGIVTFADAGSNAATIKYVGVSMGGSLASGGTGKAAVVTIGSAAMCNLTNKTSCGLSGLFDYSIQ